MSLNCDVIVIRNGRSTSQVSVYNYPEHLNPFYEDDQHKRLRFWHIKNNNSSDRRNSFSLSGLKDIWTFKSFRLKKKSSTLGINKTSESPPPLRREVDFGSATNNGFYTYPRNRYTDNDFQRNATYRSSLQNMNSGQNTDNGLGFNRKDQFRSTIQINTDGSSKIVATPRRYVYKGSLTPQLFRNFDKKHHNGQLSQRSSQTSLSTNPFDSDVDDTISIDETISQPRKAASQRNQRKKRRAPAPPDLVTQLKQIHKPNNQSLVLKSSQKNSSQCGELRIEEDLNISSLTTQIENFVKASNDNTENELKNKQSNLLDKLKTTTMQTPTPITTCQDKASESIVVNPDAHTQTTKNKINNNSEITSSTINKIKALQKTAIIKHAAFNVNKNIKNEKCIQELSTDKQQTIHPECIPINLNSVQATNKNDEYIKLSSFQPELKDPNESLPGYENQVQKNVVSTKVDVPPIAIQQKAYFTTHTENELEISEDTAPVKPSTQNKPPIVAKPILEDKNVIRVTPDVHKPIKNTDTTNSKSMKADVAMPAMRQLKTEKITATTTFTPGPLKIDESNNISTVEVNFKSLCNIQPRSPLEWKHSTLSPLEIHVPPERRRSVKDIIESINRSQRLLHNAAHKYDITNSTNELNNLDENINTVALANCNDKIDISIKSINSSSAAQPEKLHSENINVENNTNKDPLKLNNEDIFQKCKVDKASHDVRESSPTASNLDWNPVPKPKRTKNL